MERYHFDDLTKINVPFGLLHALSDHAGSEGLYDPEHENQRTAPADGE